jgi:hypothetical protein
LKIDDKHFKNLPFLDYIFGYHAYPDRCEFLSDKQKKITEIDKLRKRHGYCLEVMNEWPENLLQNIDSGTFKTIHRNTGAAIRTVPLCCPPLLNMLPLFVFTQTEPPFYDRRQSQNQMREPHKQRYHIPPEEY